MTFFRDRKQRQSECAGRESKLGRFRGGVKNWRSTLTMRASAAETFLYGLRYLLGRVFGWDREPMRPEDSFLERLSQRDRCDSEITPGTLDRPFWVLYQFPGEALRETRNKTVHGFICTALVSSPNGYILYWGAYVRRASWLTRPYLVAIEPFRRVLYPAMLRRICRAWIAAYVGMSRNDTAG